MVSKQKAPRAARKQRTARKRPPARMTAGSVGRLEEAWRDVATTVMSVQARIEAEVGQILKRGQAGRRDAETLLKDVRARADRERKIGLRELRARLRVLQARLEEERRAASRAVEGVVRSTLAALNIPSRTEIAALTRKVEELSRKLEGRKR